MAKAVSQSNNCKLRLQEWSLSNFEGKYFPRQQRKGPLLNYDQDKQNMQNTWVSYYWGSEYILWLLIPNRKPTVSTAMFFSRGTEVLLKNELVQRVATSTHTISKYIILYKKNVI